MEQRQRLEETDAERVDVHAAVEAAALRRDLLGRHVRRSSEQRARQRDRRAVLLVARESEVEGDRLARRGDHQVRRLDVAVYQPALVGVLQAERGLADHFARQAGR